MRSICLDHGLFVQVCCFRRICFWPSHWNRCKVQVGLTVMVVLVGYKWLFWLVRSGLCLSGCSGRLLFLWVLSLNNRLFEVIILAISCEVHYHSLIEIQTSSTVITIVLIVRLSVQYHYHLYINLVGLARLLAFKRHLSFSFLLMIYANYQASMLHFSWSSDSLPSKMFKTLQDLILCHQLFLKNPFLSYSLNIFSLQ